MATLSKTMLSLIDVYKQQNPDGTVADIIEVLNEQNPILDDAMMMECNQSTTHMHTIRGGLPEVTWGKLYQGIPNSKSSKVQVTDTTGFVEGKSEVDVRLLELAGGTAGALRDSEAMSYLEAMNQEVADKLFYGNSASDPDQFMGLSPRFNDKSATNGNQIIDAGGTGADNTSIWMVTWGDRQCHLLYPKGTQAGVKREDKGEQNVTDGVGNTYFAKMELFRWHVGLAVKDHRFVCRVANIDVSEMAAGNVKLYDFLRKAYYQNEGRRAKKRSEMTGRMAIYCNRDVMEALDALATNAGADDSFIRLKPMEIEGQEVLTYRGIPIRESDALLNTEARVV